MLFLDFIDDGTNRLSHRRFWETESTFDYMLATSKFIDKQGKPAEFYNNKQAVFRVSQTENRRTGTTLFDRDLHDLNIGRICANKVPGL